MADTSITTPAVPGSMPEVPEIPQVVNILADTVEITDTPQVATPQLPRPQGPTFHQRIAQLYALPAPIRTFPLPTFVPHNPLSLIHILYVWVSQTIKPKTSLLDPLYQGWFSAETRSIHVTDQRSIRGLWEQGFYGKGALSRSEPSWLDREKKRRGAKAQGTAEENTRKRRQEREKTKWERARKEREAIYQKILEEAQAATTNDVVAEAILEVEEVVQAKRTLAAPVGPLELLSLPNSSAELEDYEITPLGTVTVECFAEDFDQTYVDRYYAAPVGPFELLALPNSVQDYHPTSSPTTVLTKPNLALGIVGESAIDKLNSVALPDPTANDNAMVPLPNGHAKLDESEVVGGSDTNDDAVDDSAHSTHSEETTETSGTPPNGYHNGSLATPKIKRQRVFVSLLQWRRRPSLRQSLQAPRKPP
jgi:tRNA-splicing endonuclease subunit Sen2